MVTHMRRMLPGLSNLNFGCTGDGVAPPIREPPSLMAVRVQATAPQPSSTMTFEVATANANVEVSLAPRALDLSLSTGAAPRLETLALPLGDVDVSPALLPP